MKQNNPMELYYIYALRKFAGRDSIMCGELESSDLGSGHAQFAHVVSQLFHYIKGLLFNVAQLVFLDIDQPPPPLPHTHCERVA